MQLGCSFWGLGKLFRAAAETNPCDCAILGTRPTRRPGGIWISVSPPGVTAKWCVFTLLGAE